MKTGLEFFPLDVDIFEDEKIQYVSARFGLKGEIFLIKLLGRIYRNGYYTIWDEDAALLFAKVAGRGEISYNLANDIVNELVKRGFFDKSIFDSFHILTSRGIQKRYLKACERRKAVEVRSDLCLVDPANFKNICMSSSGQHFDEKCKRDVYISGKNDNISSKNVDISKQSRVEESRVDKSRGKESQPAPEVSEELSNAFIQLTGGTNLVQIQKLSELAGKYTEVWVLDAMRIAAERGIRKLSYAEGILKDWAANGREAPKPQKKSNVHIATAEEWKGVTGW